MLIICTVFQMSTALESRLKAARFVYDLLIVAGAEIALVGEEEPLREDMAELTAVELQLDRRS